MTDPERLRESLHDLADAVRPADLHAGAVRRSRTVARREAAAGTTAALLVLALLTSGLWRAPARNAAKPPAAAGTAPAVPFWPGPSARSAPIPTTPVATHRPSSSATAARRDDQPRVTASIPLPLSRALADLPGQVFYAEHDDPPTVVRLDPADGETVTVLADAPSPVGISPDGRRIAYAQDGDLLVAPIGGRPERVAAGVSTAGQAPTWAPDGDRLLIHTVAPAILQLTSGKLTPLPAGLGDGRHFRWSGDGSKLVFATSSGDLQVAGSESGEAVPVLGDHEEPTSVDVTGTRVTTAAVVVDTVTGDPVPLPVAGTVVGTAFGPGGDLLVRSVADGGVRRLSVFAADGTLLVQAVEPVALRDLDLLAYTR